MTFTTSRQKVLFLVTEDWYFWIHWVGLARAARDAGFDVLVATRVQEHGPRIAQEGFKVFPLRLIRRSMNPMMEMLTVHELIHLYRIEKPDLVYHVAMKPMAYGSMAARVSGVHHVINVFAGLGYAFTGGGLKSRLFGSLLGAGLKAAFGRLPSVTVFQNEEDRRELIQAGIVKEGQSRVIRGMGVDTDVFSPSEAEEGEPIVLLASRMLWDKGIREFVEAALSLKRRGIRARFVLAGRCDEENPASITRRQLQQWQEDGAVEWWGHRDDMPIVLGGATLVVLPSYREGLPVSLLEASASGKPIVATDVPGCREIVRHRVNGLLVPPRNAGALAEAIELLLSDKELRRECGQRGREIVLKEFSARAMIQQTLDLFREVLCPEL